MPKFRMGENSYNSKDPFIPNGTYDFTVSGFDRRDKGSEKEYLHVKFRLMNHPDHKGKTYSENFSLTMKAVWKLEKLLGAVGYPNGAEYDTDDDDFLNETLVGKPVRLMLVTHESARGKKQGIANNGFFKTERASSLPNPEPAKVEEPKKNAVHNFLEEDE